MAAKLINLWRLSKQNLHEEQELARDKARESGGGGGGGGSGGPPRISRETLGASAVVMDLDRAHAGVPDFPQGQTVVLDPSDPSPFLGQIEEEMRQVALFTNLFKAPLFEHAAKSSDLLLVRASAARVRNAPVGAAAGETECFAVREIPRVYLCGQQEPLAEVPTPDDNRVRDLRDRLMRLALVMLLAGGGGGGGDGGRAGRSASVIDCVRLFDALYDLLSDPAGSTKDREREKVRRTNDVCALLFVCMSMAVGCCYVQAPLLHSLLCVLHVRRWRSTLLLLVVLTLLPTGHRHATTGGAGDVAAAAGGRAAGRRGGALGAQRQREHRRGPPRDHARGGACVGGWDRQAGRRAGMCGRGGAVT